VNGAGAGREKGKGNYQIIKPNKVWFKLSALLGKGGRKRRKKNVFTAV